MSEVLDEPATSEVDIHPEDPDDEWSTARVRSGLRLHVPTAALLAVIILAGGFWGGAVAEKHHGSPSSSSSALSALASRFAGRAATGTAGTGATGTGTGRTGTGGAFGGAGGAAGATAGTVIGVVGNTLDISNAAGSIVKVQVGASTTVTRTASATLAGLKVGDTVIVAGPTGANGVVNATSVRATAKGVTTGAGGGGGFGGAPGFGAGG